MELQNIINESWDIRGDVISVDNFSTYSSPHCAVVVNAYNLLFFTSSYEIYLAVYDSTDNKLSKKTIN